MSRIHKSQASLALAKHCPRSENSPGGYAKATKSILLKVQQSTVVSNRFQSLASKVSTCFDDASEVCLLNNIDGYCFVLMIGTFMSLPKVESGSTSADFF